MRRANAAGAGAVPGNRPGARLLSEDKWRRRESRVGRGPGNDALHLSDSALPFALEAEGEGAGAGGYSPEEASEPATKLGSDR